MLERYKKLSIQLFLIIILSVTQVTYAVNCDDLEASIGSGGSPTLDQIVCPFWSLLNIAGWIVGVVLVIMIIIGGIKASTAFGDPKKLQGAKQTWTFAAVGFFVVLFSFYLFKFIGGLLGVEIPGLTELFDLIQEAISSGVARPNK